MAIDFSKYKVDTSTQGSTGNTASSPVDFSKYKLSDLPAQAPTSSSDAIAKMNMSYADPLIGFAKAAGRTIGNIADLGGKLAGQTVGRVVNAVKGNGFTAMNPTGIQDMPAVKDTLKSTNTSQALGGIVESVAEFAAPGGIITKIGEKAGAIAKGIDYGSELLNKVLPFLAKQGTKALGMGTVGGVQSGDAKTGVVTGALEALSPVGATIAKNLFTSVEGFISSTGKEVLQRAIDEPGKIWDAVQTYAKNPEQKVELVDKAKTAITSFTSAKNTEYGNAIDKLTASSPAFNGVSTANDAFKNKIADFGGSFQGDTITFKNSTLTPTDQKNLQTAWTTIQNWTDHSVKGIDNLRQALGNLQTEFKIAGGNPRSSVVLADTINGIKKSLADNVPGYSKVLKDYANKSQAAKSLAQEMSANANAKPSTQLKAVMNLFNKDKSVMDNLFQVMGKKDAEDFLNEISGSILSEWLPASKVGTAVRTGVGALGEAGAVAAGISSPAAVVAGATGLAAMSPRLAGLAAMGGGAAAPALPTVRRAVTGGIIGTQQ